MQTLVLQSYRTSDVPPWIKTCLETVKSWALSQGFDYRFYGDEIFDRVPDWYLEKTRRYPQIAADLGRLHLIQEAFDDGYGRALWLDADVLITDPANLAVELETGFMLGREIWIQQDAAGKPRAYRNVHNAFMTFCKDNTFLPFYQDYCRRIIRRLEPGPGKGMAPQVVGPKLLTSLHNTLGFDLSDQIAMLSPDVVNDIAAGGGASLDLFRQSLFEPARGANLCASLAPENDQEENRLMTAVSRALLEQPELLHPA